MPPAAISKLPRLDRSRRTTIEIKETSIDALLSIFFLLGAVPILYGLHRLGLYLERREFVDDRHKNPSGGAAYNPLQEFVQPQIRHVIEVGEQRRGEAADGEGAPPIDWSDHTGCGGYSGCADP
jgi:hypothetical protein